MKMRRKWVISGMIVFVLLAVLFFGCISSASPVDTGIKLLKKNLMKQGVEVRNLSISGHELQVGIQSEGTERLTPDDIRAIRNIRNEVRSQANQDMGIKNLSIQFQGQKGNVLYDATINDITAIPDFVKKPKSELKAADAEDVLSSALESEGYTVTSLKVMDSPLDGKLAELIIEEDINAVNDSMPSIEMLISELNDSAGTGITQYNLSIENESGEQIIFLTADLIYRDFYWWQSPLLNGETWTKSKPEQL